MGTVECKCPHCGGKIEVFASVVDKTAPSELEELNSGHYEGLYRVLCAWAIGGTQTGVRSAMQRFRDEMYSNGMHHRDVSIGIRDPGAVYHALMSWTEAVAMASIDEDAPAWLEDCTTVELMRFA